MAQLAECCIIATGNDRRPNCDTTSNIVGDKLIVIHSDQNATSTNEFTLCDIHAPTIENVAEACKYAVYSQ